MDDFRSQLSALIESLKTEGITPAFLVVDLEGANQIKKNHGAEALEKFQQAATDAVVNATSGAETFTYGEERIVAILGPEWDRLKTFALSRKLQRLMPLLGQSFDCFLRPDFDVFEYDERTGISGLIAQLSKKRIKDVDVA
jgi:hypothetical protein